MLSLLVKVFGAAVATYIVLQALLHLTQDDKEPPVMGTFIPFISPILGMKRRNSRYYNHLRTNIPSQSLHFDSPSPASISLQPLR
ncbi:hypothetical protein F5Y16DRAFT_61380 [Xylariaceae sp. FL0255]|nr:hypothetical protein F5Y16DRAFT_61380 [Xylariaceae sp. FL0255]